MIFSLAGWSQSGLGIDPAAAFAANEDGFVHLKCQVRHCIGSNNQIEFAQLVEENAPILKVDWYKSGLICYYDIRLKTTSSDRNAWSKIFDTMGINKFFILPKLADGNSPDANPLTIEEVFNQFNIH